MPGFYIPKSAGSLITVIKPKAKYKICAAAVLLFFFCHFHNICTNGGQTEQVQLVTLIALDISVILCLTTVLASSTSRYGNAFVTESVVVLCCELIMLFGGGEFLRISYLLVYH
jgi:hypothetical protein